MRRIRTRSSSAESLLRPPPSEGSFTEALPAVLSNQPILEPVSKHDANNLEIKVDLLLNRSIKSRGLTITVMLPEALSAKAYPKSDLWMDFSARNRVRIAEDLSDLGNPAMNSRKIREVIDELQIGEWDDDLESLEDKVRELGLHASEYFRLIRLRQSALMFVGFSSTQVEDEKPKILFSQGLAEMKELAGIVKLLRRCCLDFRDHDSRLALYLAEYTHFNLVRTLGNIRDELASYESSDDVETHPETKKGCRSYGRHLDKMQKEEADYFYKSGMFPNSDSFQAQEEIVMRLGSLKKFFQAPTFVDVSKEDIVKRYAEPVASFSALMAALVVALVAAIGERTFGGSGFSMGAGSLIALGAVFYVLRDRMKDRSKKFFTGWVAKRMPEIKEVLSFNDRKIGTVRKWLGVTRITSLSKKVRRLRSAANPTAPDRGDAIVFKEDFLPNPKEFDTRSGVMIYHIVRVNFRRFLRYMDDAKKPIQFLSEEGQIETRTVKKFYPFLVAVEHANETESAAESKLVSFSRVLVTRKGIQRVEELPLELEKS